MHRAHLQSHFAWAFFFLSIWALSARASETSQDTSADPLLQELAKQKHNPFADQVTLPFEISSSLDVGPGNGTAAGLNIQPVIPISLSEDWKLITRTSLSVLDSPQPHRKLGFGDIELQTFLSPGLFDKWVWGFGPDLQLPTATDPELGTGKWSAGPAFGLIYVDGPWVNGILASHVWSFAGDSNRDAVSQSTIEPMVSYNFDNGWYLSFDSSMTADWNAPSGLRWTIPVGMDAGKTFSIGQQSLSLQFGTYYNIERAEGAARWLVRFQLSFVFPKHPPSNHSSNG
jgi:hypothetical protein